MSASEKKEIEIVKQIDDVFLKKLVEAGRVYGWSGDYEEVADFIQWCFDLVGKEAPDLEPFDNDGEE